MLRQEQEARMRAKRMAGDVLVANAVEKPAVINAAVAQLRKWHPGTAETPVKWGLNDVRQYDDIPYRCCQAHTHSGEPNWTPPEVPALWAEYHGTSPETARPYRQPQGAHDAYQADEYCVENDATYRCKVNATVFPPSQLPGSWEAL